MSIQFSIPARVNILGNPSDANEGDFATISAAIEIRAHAVIDAHENYILEHSSPDLPPVVFHPSEIPLAYDENGDLLKGAINRLYALSPEFQEKIFIKGFLLKIWSDVPRQSGLGGSSLFVLLTLAAMREYYGLNQRTHNDYVLAELTQRVEAKELGITCGFADRYVPLFGGLAYMDYRGKLHHAEIGQEPLVTYERLEGLEGDLPLVAVTTGVRRDSGDVHGRMRPRYIVEYEEWRKKGDKMPPMVSFMSEAWECAWRGKIALLAGDLIQFGQLMDENHRLVDEMMRYCGFEDGAGWANNLFIQAAKENGALGAKLTGAGGGGSVFALVNPGAEDKMINLWQEKAKENRLNEAKVLRLTISRKGLIIDHDSPSRH
jgi:galactokinase/mevalonate kinase-like predicted kinase